MARLLEAITKNLDRIIRVGFGAVIVSTYWLYEAPVWMAAVGILPILSGVFGTCRAAGYGDGSSCGMPRGKDGNELPRIKVETYKK